MDIELKKKKYILPRKYWPWAGGGLLVIVILVWLATSNFSSTLRVDRRGLNIGTVENAQFDDYVSVDGSVVPIQVVQISPEEGGVVLEKTVEEGVHVKKGDVIVRLNNSNLDLEILNAESELAEKQNMLRSTQLSMEQDNLNNRNEALQLKMDVQTKRRAYKHQAALQKEELNSREEYLKAKEDYELAVQKEELIQQRLKKTNELNRSQVAQMTGDLASMRKNVELVRQRKAKLDVRSTIDGEIGLLDVELGQSISPGQKIGVINDLSDYKVEAQVDEHYIDRVHTGLQATFEQNGRKYRLRVRKVYPEVREGRFKIDFVFLGERPKNIRTGQTYYIDLQLGEAKKAIIIPKGTFYSVTGGSWIFVLDKDGRKAYRRNIRIGRQNPQYYEVLEGLEPGEKVIVSGYESYKDNEILVLE
ncbi:efflux RND transporter periplasmic adaptor subunit [Marseilla massiliensis]|uniref:HlyD family efflux transporter periplasmic adaptor subunit n=1 Tax=Marseilla massiliensis TaxID=1841864 RepID=A0A938WVQ5_9BACT|nr:HlyD family efflux transporter periplasmic adaptor subunit [Marseilla massiliensis]MBM6674220.1 HlyD family efflux transporter periplasmic adaptor subunit [Marseilla massiliensis]